MKTAMKLPLALASVIVFWNVENFFPSRPHFYDKARGIAKVILSLSDSSMAPPSIVGLAEVENEQCMKTLIWSTPLRKYGYRYVHYDSPDRRGIDCALLYRGMDTLSTAHIPLRDSLGAVLATRELLLVEFDSLYVMVCHLPSKRGGSKEAGRKRELALHTIRSVADSIGYGKTLIVMGDFNDNRSPLSDSLMAHLREVVAEGFDGTIKYEGRWETIDRCFTNSPDSVSLRVYNSDALSCTDKKYGGKKPLRTSVGPRWTGGLSDHYPIVIQPFELRQR